MNIFVTSSNPVSCAHVLPDKHVVKMPLETAQMLAVAASVHGLPDLQKKDGGFYSHKSHANHPCTVWAHSDLRNMSWLIRHGLALCAEYTRRFNRIHACQSPITACRSNMISWDMYSHDKPKSWAVAVDKDIKLRYIMRDRDINSHVFLAYQEHLKSKPWVPDNYIRMPERKPEWMQ